jgi:hypothetical protein
MGELPIFSQSRQSDCSVACLNIYCRALRCAAEPGKQMSPKIGGGIASLLMAVMPQRRSSEKTMGIA